jgi:hypothetical protein
MSTKSKRRIYDDSLVWMINEDMLYFRDEYALMLPVSVQNTQKNKL